MIKEGDIKRKWQIALRRYVIEQKPSGEYAPFFGLPIRLFRNWIEIQFKDEMSWESFGKIWHIEHIVPVSFFNLEVEADLSLCWNFINIRPGMKKGDMNVSHFNIDQTIKTFQDLYNKTGYSVAIKIADRLRSYSEKEKLFSEQSIDFLQKNKEELCQLENCREIEFELLNKGLSLEKAKEEARSIRMLSNWGK